MPILNLGALTAALKPFPSRCGNPNTCAGKLLRNEHTAPLRRPSSNDKTAANQAHYANNDDQSSLAQYLLYRF